MNTAAEVLTGSATWGVDLGDVRARLAGWPAGSVHCVCSSPPYYAQRDYDVDGQLGLEATPAEYVAGMVGVFREVRRVMRPDATLWLNVGDGYASNWGMGAKRDSSWWSSRSKGLEGKGWGEVETAIPPNSFKPGRADGLKVKDRLGIPHRLVFALQADGWWWRDEIVWAKPNPMTESVRDRTTKAHEFVFLLTPSPRYFYDSEAVKQPAKEPGRRIPLGEKSMSRHAGGATGNAAAGVAEFINPETSNLRSWWPITTKPYKGAHFATMPPRLAERCIRAGTSERGVCPECGAPWSRIVRRRRVPTRTGEDSKATGDRLRDGNRDPLRRVTVTETAGWRPGCSCGREDTLPAIVLDPFAGSGTTLRVAVELGRRAVGIELNPDYLSLISARMAGPPVLTKAKERRARKVRPVPTLFSEFPE